MDEIIESLLDYAENAKSIHLAPWLRKNGKSKAWLSKTAAHYPKLKEAIEEAKYLLSGKIVNSSFYGEGNATVGMTYLPVYDKDFRDLLKWKAEIAKELPAKEEAKGAFNSWKDNQLEE